MSRGITKHGMSRSRLYQCWADMKQRCDNPHNPFYNRYGGRWITYCLEWTDFEPFMDWALSNGYRDDLTLDRIDNDGNYCPENCKWSTQAEQAANKTQKPNKFGYTGIHERIYKGKHSYIANVTRNHKFYYIGIYKTPYEAHCARESFIKERFG